MTGVQSRMKGTSLELVRATSQEVLEPGQRTLEELADVVNAEHNLTVGSLLTALRHALIAGEALLEAKAYFKEKIGWGKWIAEHVTISQGTAEKYQRLAYYKEHIPPELLSHDENVGRLHNRPGINVALEYIRGLPALGHQGTTRLYDYNEMRRLVTAGVPKKEVARMLGTSPNVVRRGVLSAADRKKLDARKKRLQQQRKTALEREETNRIARRNGGNLSECYSLLRRALDQAQAAHGESRGNQRSAIAAAIVRMHKAEDFIGTALRQS